MAGLSFEADILSDEAHSEQEKKLKIEDLEFLAEDFKSIAQVLRERYELMELDEAELDGLFDDDKISKHDESSRSQI